MPQGMSAADTPAALAAANMLAAGGVAPGGYGEFPYEHPSKRDIRFIACIYLFISSIYS